MAIYYRIQPAGLGIDHASEDSAGDRASLHVLTSPSSVFNMDLEPEGYGDEVVVIEADRHWDNGDVEGVAIDGRRARVVGRIPIDEYREFAEELGFERDAPTVEIEQAFIREALGVRTRVEKGRWGTELVVEDGMMQNASEVIWEKGSGPRSVSHWGEHPLSWWRNKIKNYRGDAPPKISIQVRTWDRSGQPAERREFDVDNLRGAKAFAKQWALDTNGSAVVEGRVHLYGEGIFTFEEFGEYRHQTPIEFYVWSVDEDFQPITRRGPWADRERDEAVRAARDIASQSNHHQVVTLGDDPGQVGFDIYKAFRARSGGVFLMSELGRVGGRLGEYRDNPEYRSGRMLVDYDSYDVRGVLAGAYRGRDTMERPTLTHVVFKKDDHDLRCGCSQPIDNVVDPYGAQVAGTPPTCPRCLKVWEKLPRELEMSDGYLGQQPNGAGYYVWVVDSSSRPLAKEGPKGPYHTLEGAKPYARISATEGAHDRIISRGRDPRSDDFEIVRKYQARTGKRLI